MHGVQSLPFRRFTQVFDWKAQARREFQLGQLFAGCSLIAGIPLVSLKTLLKLDMAASPGGTTQMIDASCDKDFVIANDSAASRLSALRTVLQTWGQPTM